MPRRRLRSFQLPGPERPQPGWGVASIAIHVLAIVLLAGAVGRTVTTRTTTSFIELGAGLAREHELPAIGQPGASRLPAPSQPVVPTDSSSGPAIVVTPRVVPIGLPPKKLADYDPVIGTNRRIEPTYGSGRLWAPPLEARLGVVDPSPDPATHAARVDSAVRARMLAFIDTMPPDSFATPPVAPWTTEIDGQTWGVDESWIYLGGIKIPSFVLALLPLPQGNYYQAKDAQNLQLIREDIMQAARQAETNADFRRFVREIRKRKDAEREERLRRAVAVEAAKKPVKRDTIPR